MMIASVWARIVRNWHGFLKKALSFALMLYWVATNVFQSVERDRKVRVTMATSGALRYERMPL
jgi:hypothetical protein